MGLQYGMPWRYFLRWAYAEMEQDPRLSYITFDEVMEQIYSRSEGRAASIGGTNFSIEGGWPHVAQVQGPPETAF